MVPPSLAQSNWGRLVPHKSLCSLGKAGSGMRWEIREEWNLRLLLSQLLITHLQCRPEQDQAQRSSALLLLPPFPILGLTPNLLKGKWKKLKC